MKGLQAGCTVFAFGVFPLLFLYAHNADQVVFSDFLGPALLSGGGALLLFPVMRIVFKHWAGAALFTVLTTIGFYSFGYLVKLIPAAVARAADTEAGMLAFLLWLLILAVLVVFLRGLTEKKAQAALKLAGVLISVLVLLQVFSLVSSRGFQKSHAPGYDVAADAKVGGSGIAPDVYYIIMDGYARQDVMRDDFSYDNQGFLDFLKERGFYVADKSNANYCQTKLSLASSLNGLHLQKLGAEMGELSRNRRPLEELIKNSRVAELFRSLGYAFVTFSSGYHGTTIKDSDHFISARWGFSEFQNIAMNGTPIPLFLGMSGGKSQYDEHRARVEYNFDKLARLPRGRRSSPIFVFAHFMVPHPPFVFTETGESVPQNRPFKFSDGSHYRELFGRGGYVPGYAAQAKYVTKRLQQTIHSILADSKGPCVIIVQSDHGPGSKLDHESLENTDIHERFAILNAYYFPGGQYEGLYPNMTPVNSFSVVFDQFFGLDIPKQEDRSFFSTWDQPYRFHEVTDLLQPAPREGRVGGD